MKTNHDPTSKLTTANVDISHRKILIGGACMAAAASLPMATMSATAKEANVSTSSNQQKGEHPMPTIATKDGTQIIWGAELGEYAKYLEASDDEKIAKLYTFNKDVGLLGTGVKYINLRNPQDKVPQPIDKYR